MVPWKRTQAILAAITREEFTAEAALLIFFINRFNPVWAFFVSGLMRIRVSNY